MARQSTAQRFGTSPRWRPGQTFGVVGLRLISPDRPLALRCYPPDDTQFEEQAKKAVGEGRSLSLSWEKVLEHVRDRLKELYPGVRVQPRDPIASGDDPDELWYCYRDGGILPPIPC